MAKKSFKKKVTIRKKDSKNLLLGKLLNLKKGTKMKYVVYKDAKEEWRWSLKADNGRIIADSGEGYNNKKDCLHGIDLVKNSKNAPEKIDPLERK